MTSDRDELGQAKWLTATTSMARTEVGREDGCDDMAAPPHGATALAVGQGKLTTLGCERGEEGDEGEEREREGEEDCARGSIVGHLATMREAPQARR